MDWKGLFPKENKYYETEKGILYCGDCLKIMQSFPERMIDLVLTDPPYNISKEVKIERKGGKFGTAKEINLDFGEWDKNQTRWIDFLPFLDSVLKPFGVIILFYDQLEIGDIGKYLREKGYQIRHVGAWVKSNPSPQARKVQWQSGLELFLIASKNKGSGHHFNYHLGQSPNYFIHSVSFPHLHPTQKPVKMMEWFISFWSFENDLIFDPFLGSGTTAVVAESLNRRWVGIELNEKYCEITKKRILELKKGLF